MDNQDNSLNILANHVTHTIDLPDFLEELTKTSFKWMRESESAMCNCPMTWHTDKNASFHMNKMEDGVWLYRCFGCHSSGNIIKFYMEFTGEEDYRNAVIEICKKRNIQIDGELPIQTYKYVVNRVDKKREVEMANIVSSNLCRKLLQKDLKKHGKWVAEAYKRLNKALDEDDCEEIERIGNETYNKFVQ